MIQSSSIITFRENDLQTAFPACLSIIAAAFAHGWRLAGDGNPNHSDVLCGPKHIQDFKHTKQKELHRVITWRFFAAAYPVEGEIFRVEQFIDRCRKDAAFLKAAMRHPRYPHWEKVCCREIPATTKALQVGDSEQHDRTLTVPQEKMSPKLLKQLADQFESGW